MIDLSDLIITFYNRYLPRAEIAYRLPVGLPIDRFWPEELAYRKEHCTSLPLRSFDGHPYWFCMTERFIRCADRLAELAREELLRPTAHEIPDREGVMEEAYYSSVIEGACTTREGARDLILTGRAPCDRSERMILNNYNALQLILEHPDAPMDEELILTVGRILTEDTLEPGTEAGYRDGPVYVKSARGELLYTAPAADCVPSMMAELISFLNDDSIHPVVKACAAHIFFVTVHPFFDGNGRTARALSWMILLRTGYGFLRRVPVSGLVAEERSGYYKAIRSAQSPDNGYDFTYFMECYGEILVRAAESLLRRSERSRRIDALADVFSGTRDGERLLKGVRWLTEEDIPSITSEKWKNKFGVSFETARQDLRKLTDAGFLRLRTVGRKNFFDVQE